MPPGQPTKYNDEVQSLADEYLSGFPDHGHVLPTVEGLSEVLGVTRQTIYNWADPETNRRFFDTLETLKARQHRMLFEKGLTGDYNSTIAKLGLSSNHGMIEKSAKELTGADGGPIAVQEVRRTIVDPQHSNG